jgi:predicted metalloprotease with PDZ domain
MKASSVLEIPALVLTIAMLAAAANADEAGPESLIPQLAHEDFQTREQATKNLIQSGRKDPELIQRLCLHQLLTTDEPEIAARCRQIIVELLTVETGFIGIRHFTTPNLNLQANTTATISEVLPGLPAAAAGLRVGDRIIALDGQPLAWVDTASDLSRRIGTAGPGKEIEFEILRFNNTLKIKVTTAAKSLEQQGIDADALFKEWLLKQQSDPPPQ